MAIGATIGDLYDEQRRLTHAVIKGKKSIAGWLAANADNVRRSDLLIDDLKATETRDLPKLMVALRNIRAL